jgi:hypothetical protein
MMTKHIGTKDEVRERARKSLTDYLKMYIPQSWDVPLEKLKLLLLSNGDIDWEALKGQSLQFFDERRLAEDRVETLSTIDRLGESFKEIFSVISPAEWYKTVEEIFMAANFRTHKIAVQKHPPGSVEEILSVSESQPKKK